jgi:hypothetical protein
MSVTTRKFRIPTDTMGQALNPSSGHLRLTMLPALIIVSAVFVTQDIRAEKEHLAVNVLGQLQNYTHLKSIFVQVPLRVDLGIRFHRCRYWA